MSKFIYVAGPSSRGAPYPKFNPKAINESRFADGDRYKEYDAVYNPIGQSYVEWKAQVNECHSKTWEAEVKRAFAANGAKPGTAIKVIFGSRGNPTNEKFTIIV